MKNSIFAESLTFGRQALQRKKIKDDFGRQNIQHELQVNLPEVVTGAAGHLLSAKDKKKNVTESFAPLIKAAKPALTQALVWGSGSVAATLASRKKRKLLTPEERKKARKDLLVSGGIGALAGGVGSVV